MDKHIKDIKNESLSDFSVYIDKTVKNTPPKEDFLQPHMNSMYPKISKTWIDDSLVKKCQSCSTDFGIFTRKHHCRACGNVFCHTCCNKYMDIPNNLIDKPEEINNISQKITKMIYFFKKDTRCLVCESCFRKIKNLLNIEYLIKICEFMDLKQLFKIIRVSKNWHNAVIHMLSKFRNIQYLPSDSSFNSWESNILWDSRRLLMNHSIWLISLIKSVIGSYYSIKDIPKNKDNDIKIDMNKLKQYIDIMNLYYSKIIKDDKVNIIKNFNMLDLCSNIISYIDILKKINMTTNLKDYLEPIKELRDIRDFYQDYLPKVKLNEFKSLINEYFKKLREQTIYNNLLELIELINNDKNTKSVCWILMCSRKCTIKYDILDLLDIMQYIGKIDEKYNIFWKNNNLKNLIKILVKKVDLVDNKLLEYIMPFLSITFRYLVKEKTDVDYQFFNEILDNIIKKNDNINIALIWELSYLHSINDLFGDDKDKIIKVNDTTGNKSFYNIVNTYIKNNIGKNIKDMMHKTMTVIKMLSNQNPLIIVNKIMPIYFPFNIDYVITEIIDIEELRSSSKPLLITTKICKYDDYINKECDKKDYKKAKFIIKKDTSLRKENIVSSLVSILQLKLMNQSKKGRLETFEPIPTYKIFLVTEDIGIIEFVESSITLRQINENGFTLQNYIEEHNKNVEIGIIKNRFIKSLAISSCLSYILGLGDRHLDNIMINTIGLIFHIDYGYIMENPLTNILGAPIIRVTPEMITFLGGMKSEYYIKFKNYIIQVFDILRLYNNVILNFYYVLSYEKFINWEDFKKRISNRFLYGMTCKDVEINLISEIETGTNTYSNMFIDTCHHYSQKFGLWKISK